MNPGVAIDRDRVGPYQLLKAIGAGGSARVDLARIERAYGFQRHVVIKRPLEHLRADPRASESLRREARLGSRLRHPNLVAVLDAGMHDHYDYIVLEYVHGGSLRTLMESEDPARVREQPLDVALAIVRDIARGLHQAHELTDDHGAPLGLVHRDVSPGNVLIGLDGAVKLADFGIAKETRVATLSGSMHGTVTYMAPEQCRGHAFDRRADVFSLGVVLYELVTGTRLFWADNDVASLHRVLAGTVPRPRKVKPSIAAALEDIIMTALAPDPERRLASARVLADELEAFGAAQGAILGARHIARWAHELLGAREAPWIGATTAVDIEPVRDEPLVELIAAMPAEDPPPLTFGPTSFDENDIDTARSEPPHATRRRSRTLMTAVIVSGLAAGSAITAAVMLRDEAPTATPPAVPEPAPPIAMPPDPPKPIETPRVEAPVTETVTDKAADQPTEKPAATKRSRKRRDKPVVAAPPPPPPLPATGTGSATSAPPKVEWDPKMLLPTDKRK